MSAPRAPSLVQVAALPYRQKHAAIEVLLITSRQTGRWVVPKGNLMLGKASHEAAGIEAEEEAGVRGIVSPLPLGHFIYDKYYADGRIVPATVELFAMRVTEVMKNWIEIDQRQRRWFTAVEAASAVSEPELGELIRCFGKGEGPRPAE